MQPVGPPRALVALLRLITVAMLKCVYRFRAMRIEHVPCEGSAVLVCNHVSFIDFLFVAAALPRLPRFVMHHHHFEMWTLRWFFELFRVIPIAPQKEDPARLHRAMDAIDDALAAGDLVAIFPEGQMTPDGELSEFRPGVERIVARRPVPVVPLALRGLWGSFFSRAHGEPMTKLPRRIGAKVELVADEPIAASCVSIVELRTRIAALRGTAR